MVGHVDRVFILLAALSQRSLMGPSAANIVESILSMLTRLLLPLNVGSHSHHPHSPQGLLALPINCDDSVYSHRVWCRISKTYKLFQHDVHTP